MRDFQFIKDEAAFYSSKRFRLIEFRANEEPEFKGFKMIPPLDRFVGRDVFVAYERRKVSENSIRDAKDENEIEAARMQGRRILRKIRENIFKRFRQRQHQKTLSDMIVEETIPNLTYKNRIFEFFF